VAAAVHVPADEDFAAGARHGRSPPGAVPVIAEQGRDCQGASKGLVPAKVDTDAQVPMQRDQWLAARLQRGAVFRCC